MKKLLGLLIAAALVFVAVWAFTTNWEGERQIVRITKGDVAKTIDVQMANLQKENTFVIIQDMTGKNWYHEYVWDQLAYFKRFDLTGMPNGQYICYVKNPTAFYTQSFELGDSDLAFYDHVQGGPPTSGFVLQTGNGMTSIARITKEDADVLRVQFANVQEQPVLIQLSSLGDAVVYSKDLKGEQAFAENINMKGMTDGAYFLFVHVGDASLMQFFDFTAKNGILMGDLERMDVKRVDVAAN